MDKSLPAFPLFCGPGDLNNSVGLTKRELLAAMAMQGLCARDDHEVGDYNTKGQHEQFNRRVVTDLGKQAVNIADALLAALESGERSRG